MIKGAIGHGEPLSATIVIVVSCIYYQWNQKLTLHIRVIHNDDGGDASRVLLHHLKELHLVGDSQDVIRLLHRLDHPRNMDGLWLILDNCMALEISQTIGPYFQDYLWGRDRSQNGLGLFLTITDKIVLHAGNVRRAGLLLRQKETLMDVRLRLNEVLPRDIQEKVILNPIAHAPQEKIVCFQTWDNPVAMENVYARFPNLRTLSFERIPLSAMFPRLNLGGDEEILRSLQCVVLRNLVVDGGDWSPLTTFLTHRAFSGNRLNALKTFRPSHICLEVVEDIRGMVHELKIELSSQSCPFGICS